MSDQIVLFGEGSKVATESPVEHLAKIRVLRLQSGDGKEDDISDADGVVEVSHRGERYSPAGAEVPNDVVE